VNAGTTGNIIFISNSVVVLSSGTQNVNNNSIVTAFTKSVEELLIFLLRSFYRWCCNKSYWQ
jgi:hypothetical protein